MDFNFCKLNIDDDVFPISHLDMETYHETKVILNPCFDDYLLVQMMIQGYLEMTDINKTISDEFLSCDVDMIQSFK